MKRPMLTDAIIQHIRSVVDAAAIDRQAIELMKSGVPEDAAYFWAVPVAYAIRAAVIEQEEPIDD